MDRADLIEHLRLAIERYGADLPLRMVAPPMVAVTQAAAEPAIESAAATAAAPSPRRSEPAAPAPTPVPAAPALPPSEFESLEALAASFADCTKCKLSEERNTVVFGEGAPDARVLFIGEAPGFHEDRKGRPFVGPAGQLLDRIIENAMGMARTEVYIANVNKCRPPGNRDPQPDEVAACLPHLREQIRLIRPEVIVTLGRIAAQNLLSTSQSMRRLRGQDLSYEGVPVVATWHPAYLLRNEAAKADTWEDIKRVNRLLGNPERPSRRGR